MTAVGHVPVWDQPAQRIVFGGPFEDRVREQLAAFGWRRALLLSTPEQDETMRQLASALDGTAAGCFAGARMHTPTDVSDAAAQMALSTGADCVVAVGGGSTVGLGKALASRLALPQVAVPTTFAGSEMTSVLGETVDGRKTTRRLPHVLPRVVVYDPALIATLPVAAAVNSALNGVAHAVEALYAPSVDPISASIATAGIALITTALGAVARGHYEAAEQASLQRAACFCGISLERTTMGLHHRLCHVLGGTFGLAHAETHAAVLPHVMAVNLSSVPAVLQAVQGAVGHVDPASRLQELTKAAGGCVALRDLGLEEAHLPDVAREALASPYVNPRTVSEQELTGLLRAAWAGRRPRHG